MSDGSSFHPSMLTEGQQSSERDLTSRNHKNSSKILRREASIYPPHQMTTRVPLCLSIPTCLPRRITTRTVRRLDRNQRKTLRIRWKSGSPEHIQICKLILLLAVRRTAVNIMSCRGGGNANNPAMDRSRPPLRWMVFEAGALGLRTARFDRVLLPHEQIEIRESLTWAWWPLELFCLKRLTYTRQESGKKTTYKYIPNFRVLHLR